MNFSLTDEQAALVAAVQSILQDHADLAQADRHGFCHHDAGLQRVLDENGFLDAGRELGALAAALVALEASRIPAVVEVANTALVAAKLLPEEKIAGPVAIIGEGTLHQAHRNLPISRTALVEMDGDVAVVVIDPATVEAVKSVYAYPYGRFRHTPDLKAARKLRGARATLLHWWRVGLAVEFAGAAESAVAFTVDYVKQRHVLGRPVGAFQSVQHRLVQCRVIVDGIRHLVLRAAWSGDPRDADMAACYAQQHVRKLLVDLHQFNGAMGVTNEHLLHFWTYRLRALQSEAGGMNGAALDLASARWGEAGTETGAHVASRAAVTS
jgi:alkylation response protein AidB-like acyl-CoA dehydrogenase